MKRRLAVLSTGRQDWGILRSLCHEIHRAADFELLLVLGGMHLCPAYGRTRDLIAEEGVSIAAEPTWFPDDGELDPALQAARALEEVAGALRQLQPEALVLAGDRLETASAAMAATLCGVPLVHLHGGEETHGAFDNQLRHAITKMSHLHLTSHPAHAARVRALGEAPAQVHVVGAPGLDNLRRTDLPNRAALENFLGLRLDPPVILVTMHPATLAMDALVEAECVVQAMDLVEGTYVVTLPNSDAGKNNALRHCMQAAASGSRRVAVEALGELRYWALMRLADAMLGNSSSGLIEAPAVGLPVVNVGERQQGRLRGGNVLDAPAEAAAISHALHIALTPAFRETARRAPSPFGSGDSAQRIMKILRAWTPPKPPVKPPIPL